ALRRLPAGARRVRRRHGGGDGRPAPDGAVAAGRAAARRVPLQRPGRRRARAGRVRRARLAGALLALAAAAVTACQEELVAPGDCPALCPGDAIVVYDTIIEAEPGLDSSYVGYL